MKKSTVYTNLKASRCTWLVLITAGFTYYGIGVRHSDDYQSHLIWNYDNAIYIKLLIRYAGTWIERNISTT